MYFAHFGRIYPGIEGVGGVSRGVAGAENRKTHHDFRGSRSVRVRHGPAPRQQGAGCVRVQTLEGNAYFCGHV